MQTRLLPPLERAGKEAEAKLPTVSLLIGVLALMGCVFLTVMYFQQERERQSLVSQLNTARRKLVSYGAEASRAERLSSAQALLATAQDYFPDTLSSAAVLDSILKLAQETHVRVTEVAAQPGKDTGAEGRSYVVLSVNLQVSGGLREIQAFLDGLEKGAVKAVSIDRVIVGGVRESPAASISVSAYARQ